MRYVTLSSVQLAVMTVLMSLVTAVVVSINSWYLNTWLLPQVHFDGSNQCVKVVNFENGHAFSCNDVNVLLRRYRTVTAK